MRFSRPFARTPNACLAKVATRAVQEQIIPQACQCLRQRRLSQQAEAYLAAKVTRTASRSTQALQWIPTAASMVQQARLEWRMAVLNLVVNIMDSTQIIPQTTRMSLKLKLVTRRLHSAMLNQTGTRQLLLNIISKGRTRLPIVSNLNKDHIISKGHTRPPPASTHSHRTHHLLPNITSKGHTHHRHLRIPRKSNTPPTPQTSTHKQDPVHHRLSIQTRNSKRPTTSLTTMRHSARISRERNRGRRRADRKPTSRVQVFTTGTVGTVTIGSLLSARESSSHCPPEIE